MPEFKVTLQVELIVDAVDSIEAERKAISHTFDPGSVDVRWLRFSPNGINVKPYNYGQERELGRWDSLQ